MAKQISDPSIPTLTTIPDNSYWPFQNGVGGTNSNIKGEDIKAEMLSIAQSVNTDGIPEWTAKAYLQGQKVRYKNLELKAVAAFTSSSILTEIEDGDWTVSNALLTKNKILAGEIYVVPTNFTAISTNLEVEATGTIEILTDAVMRNYGEVTDNGTINGKERLSNHPL